MNVGEKGFIRFVFKIFAKAFMAVAIWTAFILLWCEIKVYRQKNEIKKALVEYERDCGKFPTEQQGLLALREKPVLQPVPEKWNGPYTLESTYDVWGRKILLEDFVFKKKRPAFLKMLVCTCVQTSVFTLIGDATSCPSPVTEEYLYFKNASCIFENSSLYLRTN